MSKRILAIGDAHFPFVERTALKKVLELIEELKPNIIVQMGDLYDMYAMSRFPRTHNIYTPRQEIDLAKDMTCGMWRTIRKLRPKAECYQITGNHDERPRKRLLERCPELEDFLDMGSLYNFPGVEWIKQESEELILGDILFMHGFRSKLGDHVYHNGMNTVRAHDHLGGVVFQRKGKETIWELDVGFIGDPKALPMQYGKQTKIERWTLGAGFIDEMGPRFIPF